MEKLLNKQMEEFIEILESDKDLTSEDVWTSHEKKEWLKLKQQELLKEALAEERERMVVSWDIADGGTEWVVQFWKVEVDGTKTLLQQLDKDSDDGGSFYLFSLDTNK